MAHYVYIQCCSGVQIVSHCLPCTSNQSLFVTCAEINSEMLTYRLYPIVRREKKVCV
jgi:hypothetical protein